MWPLAGNAMQVSVVHRRRVGEMRRRKIDLLPTALRDWLKQELEARGFADYDAITDALNARLDERGLLVTIGRSAIAAFGAEHAEFIRIKDEASGWALEWMGENGLEEEAKRHSALFEMISTLAFKCIKAQFNKEGGEIDTRDLHLLGRMLKDLMQSSGIREALSEQERERLVEAERKAAVAAVSKAARKKNVSDDVIAALREAVEGPSQGGGVGA